MFSKVLVALDETARAPGVLRAATEIAARFGATLRLFRSLGPLQAFPAAAAGGAGHDRLPAYLREQATREIAELARGNALASAEPPIIVTGAVERAILDAADSVGADLIVIGSHGVRGWDHLLGTLTGSLAEHARRHVLVVHER